MMASDASETGEGFVIAKRLSMLVVKAAKEPEARDDSQHNGIVATDFFAGIGGLLRRCGLRWEHHVVIEQDPGCRRLIRRTWPGGAACTDIAKLELKDLLKGGGSPPGHCRRRKSLPRVVKAFDHSEAFCR